MPTLIDHPTKIKAAGTLPKLIEEYIGAVNSSTKDVSIAIMNSPCGWVEPAQKPEFNEYSIVLKGMLQAETKKGIIKAKAGQAIHIGKNEWVRYSTPEAEGAQYISVCIPAFTPEMVHRDE